MISYLNQMLYHQNKIDVNTDTIRSLTQFSFTPELKTRILSGIHFVGLESVNSNTVVSSTVAVNTDEPHISIWNVRPSEQNVSPKHIVVSNVQKMVELNPQLPISECVAGIAEPSIVADADNVSPKLEQPGIEHNKKETVPFQIPNNANHPHTLSGETKIPSYFMPRQENTLFWSVFLAVYGMSEYLAIGMKYVNAEIEEKQRVIEGLQKCPKNLKSCSFKLTNNQIQELYSSLMVNRRDHFLVLMGYAVYYNKTFIVMFENKSYLVFSPNVIPELDVEMDTQNVFILKCVVGARHNTYALETGGNTKSLLTDLKHNYIRLSHFEVPLRSVSSFGMDDLHQMAEKLGIKKETGKWKKSELYVALSERLSLEQFLRNVDNTR